MTPPSTSEAAPTSGWSAELGAVTTSVAADAGLSDAELAQWCGQAKSAMASLGTTDAQIVLGLLQSDASWTQSTPAQQAGVIDAVNMASRGEC
ncbi:putative membrane protein [Prescottella equi]|uniref:lipoprotein LpqV n=1 Tax=Rhodococcus hoagii TaxID=43767 RepID=UPI003398C916